MIFHTLISNMELHSAIRKSVIRFAGNNKLKIYGYLDCFSGKRMKKENRLFFLSESEAVHSGFRPCANCMRDKYRAWKENGKWKMNSVCRFNGK